MVEIFEFPSGEVRSWTGIEQDLRDQWTRGGASPEMQDEVLAWAREFYLSTLAPALNFRVEWEMPISPPACESIVRETVDDAITKTKKEFETVASMLFAHLIGARIELYYAKHGINP